MSDEKKPQPVAWLCQDLIMQTSDVITNKWLAEKRADSAYAGKPAWKVEPLYSEAAMDALRAERDEADNALVDKYRDPKTGMFSFPGDVAAIVRRLEAAEAALARAREALTETENERDRLWMALLHSKLCFHGGIGSTDPDERALEDVNRAVDGGGPLNQSALSAALRRGSLKSRARDFLAETEGRG